MSNTWTYQALGNICTQITDGKHGDCENETDSGYYFISSKDVFEGAIHYEKARQITKKDFMDTDRRTRLEPNDIVITNSGTIGRMALVKDNNKARKTTFQKSVAILKPDKEKVDTQFLYYLLLSKFKHLTILGGGSAQHNLLLGDLRKFKVQVPLSDPQKEIGAIIYSYDKLIENNENRIKILEETAQRLYAEWFIKFRFPGLEKVKTVDSSLGKIPKGWSTGFLRDIVENISITSKPGETIKNRKYVPIDCIDSKELLISKFEPIESAKSSLILFEKGDILFGAMRPYFHKVALASFPGVTRTTCLVLRPYDFPFFSTLTIFGKGTVNYATSHAQGSTIPYVNWENSLEKKKIILPEVKLLKRFESLLSPLFLEAENLKNQKIVLTETRDLLIPQLVTGKRELKN